MKNVLSGSSGNGEKYIRLGSLLLMLIFTVCSFAVMWTAVSSFKRISSAYDSASEGLAAAQFAANHIRRAAGDITVYSAPDGSLEKMVISRGDGYDNVICASSGVISEALVPEGTETSRGQAIFDVGSVGIYPSEKIPRTVRIEAADAEGKVCTVYAYTEKRVTFVNTEAEK
ncbi:MAG: hypothetical protein NC120_01120 [Ruminococcus sp.]|nr:hypothetical protein [Ruminococcus sp.]